MFIGGFLGFCFLSTAKPSGSAAGKPPQNFNNSRDAAETFEGFFCDFLSAGAVFKDKNGTDCAVHFASLYGQRGESQYGIDIKAEMANGETWAFQCKHYKQWSSKKTQKAIKDCTYDADRKFLLVTREVSVPSRDEIDKYDDWELWDSDDISREFRLRLNTDVAARILYTNFGSEWPRALLGCDGDSALLSPEAHYKKFLMEGRSFHHRLGLVAREEYITELDSFVQDQATSVFFLVGRGGLGKSRILLEWSRKFTSRNSGFVLKFSSNAPRNFTEAIEQCSKPLVIVVDDAHRFPEVRKAVFGEASNRPDVKVVVSLRPGPLAQTKTELIDFGFDTSQIVEAPSIKPLSPEECVKLIEEALGEELADRYKAQLCNLARDCPLVGVLAAELIKKGELDKKSLTDTEEFKNIVFEGLLRDADEIEKQFQPGVVRGLMRLLSLLGPACVDTDFRKSTVLFFNNSIQEHLIEEILEGLEQVGLIVRSSDGVRITPDLLSDHLAYGACYNKSGNNTTFSDLALEVFSESVFPRLLQSLSEAEWRAKKEYTKPDSVVEPLWLKYEEAFKTGSFYERRKLIDEWTNIAHLHPERSLQLASLGIELDCAPKDKTCWHAVLDTREQVLEAVPKLLKPLAESHPDFTERCLKMLWAIGKDRPKHPIQNQNHPIHMIGEIVAYDHGHFPLIQENGLSWMERLFSTKEWVSQATEPVWIFSTMLRPFFATTIEKTHWFANTVYWRQDLVNLDLTATFRSRVLDLCMKMLHQDSTWTILCALELINFAARPHRSIQVKPVDEWLEKWQGERSKALDIVVEAMKASSDPIIHFRIQKLLADTLRRDQDDLDAKLLEIFSSLNSNLEFNLYSILMGENMRVVDLLKLRDKEIPEKKNDEYWPELCRSAIGELVKNYTSAKSLSGHVAWVYTKAFAYGYRPSVANLFLNLSRLHPDVSLSLAQRLIDFPDKDLSVGFSSLVFYATEDDHSIREKLCLSALDAKDDNLTISVFECFLQWRDRSGALPDALREKMKSFALSASPSVGGAIINFVYFARNNFTDEDWDLLSSLPVSYDSAFVVNRLFDCLVELIDAGQAPPNAVVDKMFDHLLVPLPLDQIISDTDLERIAKEYPVKTFLMLHERVIKFSEDLQVVGVLTENFDALSLRALLENEDAAQIIEMFKSRIFSDMQMSDSERSLFWAAIMYDNTVTEDFLLKLIGRAESESDIENLVLFIEWGDDIVAILEYPKFAREILLRAKKLSAEIYKKIKDKLVTIPGIRGTSSGKPDEDWAKILNELKTAVGKYSEDSELMSLYSEALEREKSWLSSMSSRNQNSYDER